MLSQKNCIPCKGGTPPLNPKEIQTLQIQVPDWKIIDDHHLARLFEFPDFLKALEFTNQLGAIAEDQGHHPNIYLTWGKVEVQIWTHEIDGLTESDFILAAKFDQIVA